MHQAGWRDLKEYMETYGEPNRWENGLIQCTRVKSNGYYTYWCVSAMARCALSRILSDGELCGTGLSRRPTRECDDKYLHTVKLFEYAG